MGGRIVWHHYVIKCDVALGCLFPPQVLPLGTPGRQLHAVDCFGREMAHWKCQTYEHLTWYKSHQGVWISPMYGVNNHDTNPTCSLNWLSPQQASHNPYCSCHPLQGQHNITYSVLAQDSRQDIRKMKISVFPLGKITCEVVDRASTLVHFAGCFNSFPWS